MATKILVTTDLSQNSKAGIRFAIQLASQTPASLIFYQVVDLPKPTRWTEDKYKDFVKERVTMIEDDMNRFVKDVYKQSGARPGNVKCIAEVGSEVGESIIAYALKIKANFICMGTRGAGRLRRLFGTHTSVVLTHSPVPVFAVPKNYRRTRMTHALYSTDLSSLGTELKQVKRFADLVKAKVSVLHYDYLYDVKETQEKLNKVVLKYQAPGVKFHFQKMNIENTLDKHLKNAIRQFNPSLLVLFTKQNRDWYERLFLSSKSSEISFDTTKPLLIFAKHAK